MIAVLLIISYIENALVDKTSVSFSETGCLRVAKEKKQEYSLNFSRIPVQYKFTKSRFWLLTAEHMREIQKGVYFCNLGKSCLISHES